MAASVRCIPGFALGFLAHTVWTHSMTGGVRGGRSRPVVASRPVPHVVPSGGVPGLGGLASLRPGVVWGFLNKQPLSVWFVCLYVFLEYFRPQSKYPALAVLPWSQATVLLGLGAVLLEKGRLRLNLGADKLLGLFTVVILLSAFSAYRPPDSWGAMELWLSWLAVYVLITNSVDTEERYFLFLLMFILNNLWMSQFAVRHWTQAGFGFVAWGVGGAPGWFQNSGEFGIEMTVFLPIALYFVLTFGGERKRWQQVLLLCIPASALIGMVASSSRGALMGAAGIGIWLVARSRYRMRALLLSAVVTAGIVAIIPGGFKARLDAMGSDPDSVRRLTMWKVGIEIMNDHPMLGIGYGNWLSYYGDHYWSGGTIQVPDVDNELFGSPQVPHNPFVQAGSELGYTGLAVYLMLIAVTFATNQGTRSRAATLPDGKFIASSALGLDGALVGYLVSGFFVTVLYYPYFWVNLAMTVALHRVARRRVQLNRLAAHTVQ